MKADRKRSGKFRRIAFVLLAGLLTVAVISSIVLFGIAKRFYRELNAVKLDPLGTRSLVVEATNSRPTLVIYGDSRAAEWPAPEWLEKSEVLNLGIGGQTSAQVLARFDAHLGPIEPEIVLLQVGINDLKTIPLFPEDRDQIVANTKDNIRQIVERCREIDAHVLLTTIFPVAEVPLERKLFWSGDVDAAIEEVNAFMESLAADGITLFETANILMAEDGRLAKNYARDFLHLNGAGYQRMNGQLKELPMWQTPSL